MPQMRVAAKRRIALMTCVVMSDIYPVMMNGIHVDAEAVKRRGRRRRINGSDD